ncbi:site-specific integrase [Lysinibacillus tabacifolii]|uniref:Site-specific integrase n=1 Tax=Lysinibacillus tabacifolii TaxID=1173107 RepID=A0ABY2SSG7_9BACI|nr:site-specific integrase [Lysinibacillus tabacifolii]
MKVEQVKGKVSFAIREGKTSKERTVYLHSVMADIAEYIEMLPTEAVYLFPSRKGDSHITTTQAYRILTKAGDMIGRHDIGTHTMRKTFGYQFYTQTKDLEQLMTILNHSSQKITLRYIGITKEDVEASIKSVTFF